MQSEGGKFCFKDMEEEEEYTLSNDEITKQQYRQAEYGPLLNEFSSKRSREQEEKEEKEEEGEEEEEQEVEEGSFELEEVQISSFGNEGSSKWNVVEDEYYPDELKYWVENNLDMKLCSETREHVDECLSKQIIMYNEVKGNIWDGTLPLRIAIEITVFCNRNQSFAEILYSRWFERLRFPFQSHNTEHLWTTFKISCQESPDEKTLEDTCLKCWKGCVAIITTGTVSGQYVMLKTLDKGAVSYEKKSYKDFIGTLKSLVNEKLGIDLVKLFEKNLNLFTYTTVDKNMFSFTELANKWHPDCLYINVGSYLERIVTNVPSEFQAKRFAQDLKSINDLICYYCHNEQALAIHFKKIIAWKLQHLSERTGVAIVLASPQNCLKSGFIRWIVSGTFGSNTLKSIKGGLWGILKDNYSGTLLEGFSVIQADEIGSKPLSLEQLEAFKNICDDQNTTQYARGIRCNWAKQTQNLEFWISSNSTEPHNFPFANMYSPNESNRRVLPLVTPDRIPKDLFEACLKIFKDSNAILMRLFVEDCNNLLAADPKFIPNRGIPVTPFIEKLRSISIHTLLIKYFEDLPQNIRNAGKVAVSTVAEALSSKIGTKIDSKVVNKSFKEIGSDKFPVKSIEIKSRQSITLPDESKRRTNVSIFKWEA